MNKAFRRAFSAALALCLLAGSAFSSHAAQNECDCGVSPIVYVAALGSATLYLDAGTPAERVLFRPTDEATQQLITQLLLPAARYAFDRNADAFAKSIAKAVDGMLGELAMDENGDSNPRVTTKTTLPTDPAHGIDKDYYFGYDFRIDPMVTADRLHEFIEHVEQLTGHEKVSLRASSLGGIVTMAYLEKYGAGDIDACIFQCCPVLGVAVAGDLFNKKIKLDPDALVRYGVQVLPQVENGELLKPLIDALDCAGVFDALLGVGDALVADLKDEIYEQLLIPVFGRMPGLWALVPDVSYESAKAVMFDGTESQILLDRIDYYHYNVMGKAKEILNAAKESGVRIMFLAGYNMQREPFVESILNNSDGVDDTIYNAPGAIVADIGTTLGDGYTQAVNDGHNHLSCDGVIDASTCFLPENTWFAKNMLHSTVHDGHRGLYSRFLEADTGFDVHSDANYPQFLVDDTANKRLLSLTPETDPGTAGMEEPPCCETVDWQALAAQIIALLTDFIGRAVPALQNAFAAV